VNSERVLSRVDTGNGALVLTTHRLIYGWQTKYTNILLEDVGSVMVTDLTRPWTLVLAGTCLEAACVVGMAMLHGSLRPVDIHNQLASALLFLSALLIVTFVIKRYSQVRISSQRAAIGLQISGRLRKDVSRFLRELEKARTAWYFAEKAIGGTPALPMEQPASVQRPPDSPPWTPLRVAARVFRQWPRQLLRPASERAGSLTLNLLQCMRKGAADALVYVGAYAPVVLVVGLIAWSAVRLVFALSGARSAE